MAENTAIDYASYQNLFWFFYGLVFHTMGLSILLHSRQYSRLFFAKSLPWLGAFGILVGFFEWGHVIVPIQIAVSGEQITPLLLIIQLVILGISFTLLFQFGIELMRPFQSFWKWSRLLPMIVFMVWLAGPFILGFTFIKSVEAWSDFANATARYMLCIPGSIFAVVGLIKQQRMQIKPMKLPFIDTMIRISAGSLAGYGLFSGVVVPKTFIFPATILNCETFTQSMVVSPFFFRALAGILLLFSMIRSLEIFSYETEILINNMESEQVASNERERIARDLHDGALQQVYAAGLLAQSLKKHLPPDDQEQVDPLLSTINNAIDQLREFLPRQKHDLMYVDLIGAIMPKINEARKYIRIDVSGENNKLPALSVDQTRHITALVGEALSNAIRHSKSERLAVTLGYNDEKLVIEIRDFGNGIKPEAELGFGLKNMRERARLLGAELAIVTEESKGTTVKIALPVEED